eukprot:7954900-Pyramimonas_sp.AAC.1
MAPRSSRKSSATPNRRIRLRPAHAAATSELTHWSPLFRHEEALARLLGVLLQASCELAVPADSQEEQ